MYLYVCTSDCAPYYPRQMDVSGLLFIHSRMHVRHSPPAPLSLIAGRVAGAQRAHLPVPRTAEIKVENYIYVSLSTDAFLSAIFYLTAAELPMQGVFKFKDLAIFSAATIHAYM